MFNDKDVRDYAEEHNVSYVKAYRILERKSVGLPVEEYGGEGSGNFGHGGRPGEVGGSGEGGGKSISLPKETKSGWYVNEHDKSSWKGKVDNMNDDYKNTFKDIKNQHGKDLGFVLERNKLSLIDKKTGGLYKFLGNITDHQSGNDVNSIISKTVEKIKNPELPVENTVAATV